MCNVYFRNKLPTGLPERFNAIQYKGDILPIRTCGDFYMSFVYRYCHEQLTCRIVPWIFRQSIISTIDNSTTSGECKFAVIFLLSSVDSWELLIFMSDESRMVEWHFESCAHTSTLSSVGPPNSTIHARDLTTIMVMMQCLMFYRRGSRPSCKLKTHYYLASVNMQVMEH